MDDGSYRDVLKMGAYITTVGKYAPVKSTLWVHLTSALAVKMYRMEEDSVVQAVVKKFLERSELGQKKYGVTLDRTDLNVNLHFVVCTERQRRICASLITGVRRQRC